MSILRKAATSTTAPWILFGLLLLAFLWIVPVDAQKKQAQQAKATDTFKELLIQHVGDKTNIGVVKKVGGDYLIVQKDENVTAIYPLSVIQALRMVKGEEGEPNTIEIALLAKD